MKMTESNRIEFKRELTDELDIEKAAVINFIVHNNTFMEHFIRFTVPFYKDVTDSVTDNVTEGNTDSQKHVEKDRKHVVKDIEHVEKDEKHVESIGTKTLQKTLQKTPQKIMDLIMKNPDITTQEMATLIGIDRSNIARAIKKLQERGLVRRVGPDKGGHWEIIENKTKSE